MPSASKCFRISGRPRWRNCSKRSPPPPLPLPPPLSEEEIMAELEILASQDTSTHRRPCFLGGGAYRHFIPRLISHLVKRGEFATGYTPYQGEVSQGTLQTIYDYQSLMCQLTCMEIG